MLEKFTKELGARKKEPLKSTFLRKSNRTELELQNRTRVFVSIEDFQKFLCP